MSQPEIPEGKRLVVQVESVRELQIALSHLRKLDPQQYPVSIRTHSDEVRAELRALMSKGSQIQHENYGTIRVDQERDNTNTVVGKRPLTLEEKKTEVRNELEGTSVELLQEFTALKKEFETLQNSDTLHDYLGRLVLRSDSLLAKTVRLQERFAASAMSKMPSRANPSALYPLHMGVRNLHAKALLLKEELSGQVFERAESDAFIDDEKGAKYRVWGWDREKHDAITYVHQPKVFDRGSLMRVHANGSMPEKEKATAVNAFEEKSPPNRIAQPAKEPLWKRMIGYGKLWGRKEARYNGVAA